MAYHFAKSDHQRSNDPDTILASLSDQLRRIFALPPITGDEVKEPPKAFEMLLHTIGNMLEHDQRTVIVLDGLDRAIDRKASSHDVTLKKLFPRELPDGVKIVLTSRMAAISTLPSARPMT